MEKIFPASALIDISKSRGEALDYTEYLAFEEEGRVGAIPAHPFTDLFRGQNRRYLPFLPAIARRLSAKMVVMSDSSIEDQASVILHTAQYFWFAKELKKHPMAVFAESQKILLKDMAVAQHYEIPTGYLDLTDSFDVAAFFATCRRTSAGWEPLADEDGEGIVYKVVLNQVPEWYRFIEALGPQPLPRPREQRAWVAEIPLEHSFDGWPGVLHMQFKHDPTVGEHFLDKFDGGAKLFPPDPLAKVAEEILGCNEIPEECLEGALEGYANGEAGCVLADFSSIRRAIAKHRSIAPYRSLLTNEVVHPFADQFSKRIQELSSVKLIVRPVRLVLVKDLI